MPIKRPFLSHVLTGTNTPVGTKEEKVRFYKSTGPENEYYKYIFLKN
jgi:hypothetical protein